ncbi:uncharacterized protein N7487_000936 [Penicillium crustosum]|uniref:uncharacterized protein n=1 Tax=Penicillium crustosum TaxID=36656 RepID=UPI00239B15BF|nr:uncharacterized protein N7487_000936 [Penicillium crustosum]KAJ5417386.1 hypothetical protein N7487_000936 [Penicillium crustosum]
MTLTNLNGHAPYKVLEQPLGTTRHVRVITIGAGASGLNMIRTLRKNIPDSENVVYEKNPDIGGTWFENRYPGCQCDIPSHNYQFSWAPNPRWSRFYSGSSEIHQYFKDLVARENLQDSIKLQHQVESAVWNEDEGQWHVVVRDLATDTIINDAAHFLLDGSGILNHWKWPEIPGLHSFKGDLVHSANWPANWDYKGKRVAVIGNGSSGVQIVPAMQPDVSTLVHVFRSPIWVAPPGLEGMSASTAGEEIANLELDGDRFTPTQISRFEEDKELYKRFTKATEEVVNNKFSYVSSLCGYSHLVRIFDVFGQLVTSTPLQGIVKEKMKEYMSKKLRGDTKLMDKLIPDFPFGCRRITPSVAYLDSLHESNMHLVTDGIANVFESGFTTESGETIFVDAIVCATGFDLSFRPRFPVIGRTGNLQDIWTSQIPSSYMSCAIPGMPNYFTFLGPNAPIGHGSVLTITEHVAKYIVRLIRKCQEEGIKSVCPKQDAVDDLNEHIAVFMPRTAWAGSCRSWFKNGETNGPVTALHPGSRIHWFHMLQNFRGEDYEYTRWTANRFQYLGNGTSTLEDPGMNSTWYLDEPDSLF